MTEKILCVDDEPSILDAYQRGLRKQFHIDTALSGDQALKAIDAEGSYAVVVSDMRMPGMDGVQFLAAVKQRAPETVRIMLTGNTDQNTAIEAVNEGAIFRFLTKPCAPETMAKVLGAGIAQYRLVTAEKELLEKTLRGSIKVLTDVLSLTNPIAFGHASRVRRLVRALGEQLGMEKSWQLEIAAMLSQIGCVTIPPDTLEKVYHGRKLTPEEAQMLDAHPAVGRNLVANIPRLGEVAEIISYQQKRFDGTGPPADSKKEKAIPIGARVLKVALDFDTLKWGGSRDLDVLVELRGRTGWYDPEVLTAMEAVAGYESSFEIREVRVRDLTTHMMLAEDILSRDGTLIVSKGQEVTPSLCQRLKNFARKRDIQEPIHVLVQAQAGSRVAQHSAQG
ncbi:MAG: response regulator [Planctomycetes bacterium]|nr:response regulator [Planctomycetota bacterium]